MQGFLLHVLQHLYGGQEASSQGSALNVSFRIPLKWDAPHSLRAQWLRLPYAKLEQSVDAEKLLRLSALPQMRAAFSWLASNKKLNIRFAMEH